MAWPWERALEIFTAWREWTALVPDDITSLCRMLQVPDLPDVPAPLRGRQLVVIEAAILGDPDMLAPLRALEPELDLFAAIAPAGLIEVHNDPKQPMPGPVRPPPARRRRRRGDRRDRGRRRPGSGSPLVSVELRHLGGALPVDAGFSLFAVGVPMDAASAMAIDAALARLMEATAPFDAGRALLNFTDKTSRADRFFDPYTLQQLRAVKHRVDGDDLFAANHAIEGGQTPRIQRREPKNGRVDPNRRTALVAAGWGARQATTSWLVTGSNAALGLARNWPGAETASAGPKAAAPSASGAASTWVVLASGAETIVTAAAPFAPTTRFSRPMLARSSGEEGIGARSCGAPIERPLTNAARTALRPLQATIPRPVDV